MKMPNPCFPMHFAKEEITMDNGTLEDSWPFEGKICLPKEKMINPSQGHM